MANKSYLLPDVCLLDTNNTNASSQSLFLLATNRSSNFNGTLTLDQSSDVDNTLDIVAAAICFVVLFLGIIGNLLVLIVFGSRWGRLRSFELYIMSLAVADFIVTITYPSFLLHEHLGGSFCALGAHGCAVVLFLTSSGVAVSSLTLVFISLDRYIVVKWPLRERQNKYKIYGLIVATWVVGCCLGTLNLATDRVVIVPNNLGVPVCRLHFLSTAQHKKFVAILFTVQSGIPLPLVTILYGLIIFELHKSSTSGVLQGRDHLLKRRHERNKKAITLLLAIIFVFVISITPEKVFYLLYTFNPTFISTQLFTPIYTILAMFFMTNSCINPILYAKLHTSFRKQTLRLFCACVCNNYRSYSWSTLRFSVQTMVSHSIRRASSRFSRNSEESFLESSSGKRQRSRSANGSLVKDFGDSLRPIDMQRTFSGPCAFTSVNAVDVSPEEMRGLFNKQKQLSYTGTESVDALKPPRLSALLENNDN